MLRDEFPPHELIVRHISTVDTTRPWPPPNSEA
jgi:hypothetical protein